MKIFKVVVAGCGVALLAACSSSPGTSEASDSDTYAYTDSFQPPESLSAATKAPDSDHGRFPRDFLISFGATVARFESHHAGSDDPNLDEGCCYGPLVTVGDGEQVNTWNLSANAGPLVTNLTRNFAVGTDEAGALAIVKRDDLPSDIKLLKQRDQGQCKTFVFRSATLQKSASRKALGPLVSINVYSPPDPAKYPTYTGSAVEQIIMSSGDSTLFGC